MQLRVGAHSKTIVALGERRWERTWNGWRIAEPAPFSRIPLTYEHAFGGPDDPRNPVGRGLVTTPLPPEDMRLPALEAARAPHHRLARPPADRGVRPAGAALVATPGARRHVRPAVAARAHAAAPLDADPRRLQSAPLDQQLALVGGEAISLRHCTPSGSLRCTLPRIALDIRSRIGGAWVQHSPQIRTVVIDADESRLVIVWHSALECHKTLYSLRSTSITASSADVSLEARVRAS